MSLVPPTTIDSIVAGLVCEIGRLVLAIVLEVALVLAGLFGFDPPNSPNSVGANIRRALEALDDVDCF